MCDRRERGRASGLRRSPAGRGSAFGGLPPTVMLAVDVWAMAPRGAGRAQGGLWGLLPGRSRMAGMLGDRIVPFSFLRSEPIPPDATHGYWVGGFPDGYPDAPAVWTDARQSNRARVEGGWKTAAECGGWMMMARMITGLDRVSRRMLGVAPRVFFRGAEFRGHKCHDSRIDGGAGSAPARRLPVPGRAACDGYGVETRLAGRSPLDVPPTPAAVRYWLWGSGASW